MFIWSLSYLSEIVRQLIYNIVWHSAFLFKNKNYKY